MNPEQFKLKLIATHEVAKTLLLWLAVIAVCITVYALWTWRDTNQMIGATNADVQSTFTALRGTIKTLNDKLDTIDTTKVNDRLDALGQTQRETDRLIASVRNQSERITSASVTRINQLGENLLSLKSVTDETRIAVAGLTTSTTALMDRYGLTADEAAKAIALASEKTGRSIDELNRQIANPRWAEAADNLVATTGNANKLVLETTATITDVHTDLHGAMVELPAIARDVKKTTGEISRYARISIVVSIISRLASALIPGLLN